MIFFLIKADEKSVEGCIREILQVLRQLTNSTRGIAATSNDNQIQQTIIERSHDVLERSTVLVREAKKAVMTPSDLILQTKLTELAREVSSALNACLCSMPSQRYLDEAIKQMSAYIYTLAGPFDGTDKAHSSHNFEEKQSEISSTAANLNQATTDFVVSTRAGTTHDIGKASTRFTKSLGQFLDTGVQIVHHQTDEQHRNKLLSSLKNVHTSSNQLFERAKTITIEPQVNNEIKQELTNAARSVTEHVNHVVTLCVSPKVNNDNSLCQIECDNAKREIETGKTYLQQVVLHPVNNSTYFEALDSVVDNSKRLGEAMTHVASASKSTNHILFKQAIQDMSKAACRVAESSAQV